MEAAEIIATLRKDALRNEICRITESYVARWPEAQEAFTAIEQVCRERDEYIRYVSRFLEHGVERLIEERDAAQADVKRLLDKFKGLHDEELGRVALDVTHQAVVRNERATAIAIGCAIKRYLQAIDAAMKDSSSVG